MGKTPPLTIRPLRRSDWAAIERLFGEKGACGGCWCMWWRVEKGGRTWDRVKGEPNRRRFKAMIKSGEVYGVLAFAGREPVGWCSFGPHDSFPRLARARTLQRPRTTVPWSIVCFYILPAWRKKGVATRLLRAATPLACKLGAPEIEGYPVNTRPGAELPALFAWTGLRSMFERAGYRKVERLGVSRDIYLQKCRRG